MNLDRAQHITDIVHGTILYSGLEGAIISNPLFNRLHHITQSSLVPLTFSSNRVKRFEHSLGVMHLSGEILYQSIKNTRNKDVLNVFFERLNSEIINWFDSIDFKTDKMLRPEFADTYRNDTIHLAPSPSCSIYSDHSHVVIEQKNMFGYNVLFQATRIAGLLHDIGHLPYSHIFEHAIKQMYNSISKKPNKKQAEDDFLDIFQEYFGCNDGGEKDPPQVHEEIGVKLIDQIKAEIAEELSRDRQEVNLFVSAVFCFVKKILKPEGNLFFEEIHRIISGSIDADRLDYCSRDLLCCGVRRDIINYQRILSTYQIKLIGDDQQIVFCTSTKTLAEVEDVFERRWQINRIINYHHRVHKHEEIFTEILALVGEDELNKMEGHIQSPSSGVALPLSLTSVWNMIRELKKNNSLIDYLVIQLDDSWLDTYLKFAFFERYQKGYRDQKNETDPIWNKFDELISTKKHYVSLFKRSSDIIAIDKVFGEKITASLSVLEQTTLINNLIVQISCKKQNVLDKLNINLALSVILEDRCRILFKSIEDRINTTLKNDPSSYGIKDCMIRPCSFSIGFDSNAPVYFLDDNNKVLPFNEVSKEQKLLLERKETALAFHVFYLPHGQADTEKLMQLIIEELANSIIDEYKDAQKIC